MNQKLNLMQKNITEWWNAEGFGSIAEIQFDVSGIRVVLGCTDIGTGRIEILKEKGYKLFSVHGDLSLKASVDNITVLKKELAYYFPSAKVMEYKTCCLSVEPYIDQVTIIISDYKDLINIYCAFGEAA